MTLLQRLKDVVARQALEFKTIRELISGSPTGNTSNLLTTSKHLVGAINEVRASAAGQALINDSAVAPASTWSSTKIQSELAAVSGYGQFMSLDSAP